ncbi:hypothetical protein IJI31_06470 [bacterium]|nr:hypothetical protein [bacterium]
MSNIIQLLCNRFGGIRERNSYFSDELITAHDLQNIELYFTGTNSGIGIRTSKGNTAKNSELKDTAKIIKLFESTQQQTKYFFVYAETSTKGTFYYIDSQNHLTTLKDNLTPTGKANGFDVVQGWSDLFFFTNGAEMFTVEMGTSSNTIVDMELQDKDGRDVIGINAILFDNRLWIAKDNILWYSKQADIYEFAESDPEVVTSAGYIERLKNITAIHEYLGSLAVFFADSSEQISVSDGIFSIGQESPGGCAGYNSLVFHDTNLYFYDDTKKSVFSFKQVITGEKTLGENVAVEIQSILNGIDSRKLDEIQTCSVFVEGRNEIWWIIPSSETYDHNKTLYAYVYGTNTIYADSPDTPTVLYNSTGGTYSGSDWQIVTGTSSATIKYGENAATYTSSSNKTIKVQKPASIILIYDYLKGEWIKRKSQKINSVSVVNNTLYSAGNDGFILEEYTGETFNGDFIQNYYNCSPMNLGQDNTLKVLGISPRVSFDMPYNNQFYVKYVKNYNTFKNPKIRFIKSKLKNYLYWGIGYWGVNYWADKNTSVIGKLPNATFKILEISLYTEKSTETFSIKNIEFSKIKVKQL